MFRSPFDSFSKEDQSAKPRTKDAASEPLKKASRTSATGKREPNEGLEDVAHSATLHAHNDGSYSVETADEGLSKHDSYESAADHMGKAVGRGDNFGMDSESDAGSEPSKLTKRGPRDDMSGAEM